MSISGSGEMRLSSAAQMCGVAATMAVNLGAARRHALDQAVQVGGESFEFLFFGKNAGAIDVGVRDQHARHAALRLMRGEQIAIVINRRARPEAADQTETPPFFAP